MASNLAEQLRDVIADHVRDAPRETLLTIAAHLADDADARPLQFKAKNGSAARFALIGDDQVLDTHTDLIWSRGNVPGGQMNWKAAQKACAEFNLGGAKWQLPTIQQLLTLVDYERHEPAIDPIFHCEKSWYWTSTPYAAQPAGYAWLVLFGYGGAYLSYQFSYSFVRACRPRQSL